MIKFPAIKDLLLVIGFLPFMLFAADIQIFDSKHQKVHELKAIKYTLNERNIRIINYGPVNYSFFYNYTDDPEYLKAYPMAQLPIIGDFTAGNTGIGLEPSWYKGGILKISINNKSIFGQLAEIKIIQKEESVELRFTWHFEDGQVKAFFTILQNDDKIYCQVELFLERKIQSFSINLLALPGHYGLQKKIDRWASTAERNWQRASDGLIAKKLDPSVENWIVFYDSQSNKQLGSAALLFDPQEIQMAQIGFIGDKCAEIGLAVKPQLNKVRFLIWGFPDDYKSAESVYYYLNENAEKFLKELRNFNLEKTKEE